MHLLVAGLNGVRKSEIAQQLESSLRLRGLNDQKILVKAFDSRIIKSPDINRLTVTERVKALEWWAKNVSLPSQTVLQLQLVFFIGRYELVATRILNHLNLAGIILVRDEPARILGTLTSKNQGFLHGDRIDVIARRQEIIQQSILAHAVHKNLEVLIIERERSAGINYDNILKMVSAMSARWNEEQLGDMASF